jgi:hypothetical protein
MRESMTLIEQANIYNKTNHQNVFLDRFSSKKDLLKNLSFDVYSSRHLPSTTKQTKHKRSDELHLPPIDKDQNRTRKQIKRPTYRTSLYHSNTASTSRIDLSLITARGTKPELSTTIRDNETVMNLKRHYAPPPSPSDEQLERLLYELHQPGQSTPRSQTETDGYIPYRLPALIQSTRRTHTDFSMPSKDGKSRLSNYLQTFY